MPSKVVEHVHLTSVTTGDIGCLLLLGMWGVEVGAGP